jgi:hypothetical protein
VIIERAERLAYLTEYPRILRPLLDRVAPATGAQPAP